MSESEFLFEELHPGDCIDFASITEIPTFEDLVAQSIDERVSELLPKRPNVLNMSAWGGRVAIAELVRPPKFNGSITDISLSVMDEPYKRLIDARERGWNIGVRNPTRTKEDELNSKLLSEFKGFEFRGNACSSGRGVIGRITAELWYAPIPFEITNDSIGKPYQNIHKYAGSSIVRFVTKPKLEKEKFLELNEESRRIAFEVLKYNIRHQIIQPMSE